MEEVELYTSSHFDREESIRFRQTKALRLIAVNYHNQSISLQHNVFTQTVTKYPSSHITAVLGVA